jgi:hypothetical protein
MIEKNIAIAFWVIVGVGVITAYLHLCGSCI